MLRKIMIAGLIVVAGSAMAQDHSGHGSHAGHGSHGSHAGHGAQAVTDSPAVAAFIAANDKMHADMAIEFTGNVDVDFMRGMIPHHQGAVDMALVALEYSENERIRALAEEIIAVQEAEIAQMRAWLAEMGY